MPVIIDELESRVQVQDSSALLDPAIVQKLVRMVMEHIKQHQEHEESVGEERKMRPSMTSREAPVWE
jgi:hypothetical protein